jgi:hypothetical protein
MPTQKVQTPLGTHNNKYSCATKSYTCQLLPKGTLKTSCLTYIIMIDQEKKPTEHLRKHKKPSKFEIPTTENETNQDYVFFA